MQQTRWYPLIKVGVLKLVSKQPRLSSLPFNTLPLLIFFDSVNGLHISDDIVQLRTELGSRQFLVPVDTPGLHRSRRLLLQPLLRNPDSPWPAHGFSDKHVSTWSGYFLTFEG